MISDGHHDPPGDVRAGDAIVGTAHSYYELEDHNGPPDELADAGNAVAGLVALGSTGAIILTGTEWGPVRVRLELHPHAPAPQPGWEETAEVQQSSPSGSVSLIDSGLSTPPGLPTLTIPPDSAYRIRVHARGRAAARPYSFGPDEPVEEHLIQLWPTPHP